MSIPVPLNRFERKQGLPHRANTQHSKARLSQLTDLGGVSDVAGGYPGTMRSLNPITAESSAVPGGRAGQSPLILHELGAPTTAQRNKSQLFRHLLHHLAMPQGRSAVELSNRLLSTFFAQLQLCLT